MTVLDALRRDLEQRGEETAEIPDVERCVAIGTMMERAANGSWTWDHACRAAAALLHTSQSSPVVDAPTSAPAAMPVSEFAAGVRRAAARLEDDTAFGLAEALLQLVLLLPEMPDLERGRVQAQRARVRRQRGDLDGAQELYGVVERLGRRTRHAELRARGALGHGVLALLRGNHPDATQRFTAAARIAERSQTHDIARAAHHGLMVLATRRRDRNAGLIHGWLAFQHAESSTDEAEALTNVAAVLSEAGYEEEALGGFHAALRRDPPTRIVLAATSGAALSAARLGRNAEAIALTDRLASYFERSDLSYQIADALATAAEALMILRVTRAEEFLEQAAILAERHGYHEIRLRLDALRDASRRSPERSRRAPDALSPRADAIRAEVAVLERARTVRVSAGGQP